MEDRWLGAGNSRVNEEAGSGCSAMFAVDELHKKEGLVGRITKVGTLSAIAVLIGGIQASYGQQGNLALPDAKAGECFAKVMVPGEFKTITEDVIVREGSTRIEITPPKFEWVSEKVLVEEATERLSPVPASYKTVKEEVVTREGRLVWRTGSSARSKLAEGLTVARAVASGLPGNAKAGECYAEYYQAPQYETIEEKILKKEASSRIKVSSAKYETVKEQVLVREGSEKVVEVPAVYETVTEKVLERPAYTTWKKGRGPIQRIDHATGEIMCKVEVPAQYKTIQRRVLKTPAGTKKITVEPEYKTVSVRKLVASPNQESVEIPAEFTTYTRTIQKSQPSLSWRLVGSDGPGKATGRKMCRAEIKPSTKVIYKKVIDTPATVKKIEVPAQYTTVKRRKLVAAATEKRIEVPAQTRQVTRRERTSESTLAWRPVLCETNATPGFVREIQIALKKAGFDPGPADGKIGRGTMRAAENFQRAKNLSTGGLTAETITALGLKMPAGA